MAVSRRAAVRWLALDGMAPVIILLVVATVLRFALLGSRELFRDEAASWLLAQADWSQILPRASAEPYAPTFAFALKAWITVLGDSPLALRSLSALAGVALVLVSWTWARAAVGPRAAIMAAALVALAPLAIANARDARMYALESLFIVVAWWLLWRLLTDARPLHALLPSGLLAAVAVAAELWTLPTGIGAFVLQSAMVGTMLIRTRHVRTRHAGSRAAVAALVAGLLGFAPWIPRMLSVANSDQPFWTPIPNLGDLPETFTVAFAGQAPSPAWIAAAPLAALAAIGVWALFRRARTDPTRLPTALAVSGGAALILLWWVVSQWRSAYDARYLGAAIPPLAIAIVVGWQSMTSRFVRTAAGVRSATRMRLMRVAGSILVLLLATGTAVYETIWVSGDDGLAPAGAAGTLLSQRVRPGDVMVVSDARSYFPMAYLLERHADPVEVAAPLWYWRSGGEPAFTGADLVSPDATIRADEAFEPAHLPGLSADGSIWLVAITDPQREARAFHPLADGFVTELERFVVADHDASALILRLRPSS
jgi:predicted membrane-bound mannosyltransferase